MSEVFRIIIEDDYRAGKGFEAIIYQTGVIKTELAEVGVASQRMAQTSEVSYNRMARGAWRAISLFAVMDMAFMRVQVAQSILVTTTERYNEAVRKHGASSRQAITANQELLRVQNYVQRSYIRTAVAVGAFILRVIIETGVLKASTVATEGKTQATMRNTIATNINNLSLAAKITLLTLGTAAALAFGVAIGSMAAQTKLAKEQYAALNEQMAGFGAIGAGDVSVYLRTPITFESSIVVEEGMDVEDAIDEQAKRLKDEWRRRSLE